MYVCLSVVSVIDDSLQQRFVMLMFYNIQVVYMKTLQDKVYFGYHSDVCVVSVCVYK